MNNQVDAWILFWRGIKKSIMQFEMMDLIKISYSGKAAIIRRPHL